MKLFTPQNIQNENDPYMISPKGIKVRVSEDRVIELLTKGFILEDKVWKPSIKEKPELKSYIESISKIDNGGEELNLTEI